MKIDRTYGVIHRTFVVILVPTFRSHIYPHIQNQIKKPIKIISKPIKIISKTMNRRNKGTFEKIAGHPEIQKKKNMESKKRGHPKNWPHMRTCLQR